MTAESYELLCSEGCDGEECTEVRVVSCRGVDVGCAGEA